MDLRGKRVIIVGERDGVPGPAIEECVKSVGAQAVMVQTQCFV
jgi:betaine reductase